MQTANDIRKAFLDYFAGQGHSIVPSSPLVPRNDPTLMFTNAGMVQFKDVFTGKEARPYSRATSSQKCVRAGGKHNDLDNVGYTARHHTFFEMLGNFSFGDYFKEGAIELAWNLVTRTYSLPVERLLVTVHASDEEAAGLWRKIAGVPDSRIIRIDSSDNFWSMGETGPCGPCSEIFFDHGEGIPGGPPGSPDQDGDRFIEIWNLVFMQFDQVTPEQRVPLAKPCIDTGMGLERFTAVLQGKHDNYDTDMMRGLIERAADAAGQDPDGPNRISLRVVADHLRSASFLVADGVLPANEGRGYVLRRIMRRAMRHAHMMGCQEPLLYRLVPSLENAMGHAYPELTRAEALITETLKLEETRFKQMLDRGLRLLEEETAGLGEKGVLPGEIAFKLYDTYGFPLDLTEDALRGRGLSVDHGGFKAAMEQQRAEARKAWSGSGETATEAVWFGLRDRLGATDFLGYATEEALGKVTGLLVEGMEVEQAGEGTRVMLLANQTPFYGESGGQAGDHGLIAMPDGRVRVTDTLKKLGDLIVHVGVVEQGSVRVGDEGSFAIDGLRRAALRGHHSATHLLHAALRRVLGEHVTQKGSLVADDRLRFDISHPRPMTAEEIRAVEEEVNREIRGNSEVSTRLMQPEEAIEAGAMALFGEKYGDEVRVVAMGSPLAEGGTGRTFSVELCGGTHVRATGDIGFFKIVGEGALASGVRRIEAVTGAAAEAWVAQQKALLEETAEILKASPADLPARVAALQEERRRLEREIAELRKKLATGGTESGPAVKQVNGMAFSGRVLHDIPPKDLKGMADAIKQQIGSGIVALVAVNDGKASLVVGVTQDLTASLSAVDLVKVGSAALGGAGGGGRPDMAQAGGPDGGAAEAALAAIEARLGELQAA